MVSPFVLASFEQWLLVARLVIGLKMHELMLKQCGVIQPDVKARKRIPVLLLLPDYWPLG